MAIEIVTSFKAHFEELLTEGTQSLGVTLKPQIRDYLVLVLENHVATESLFPKEYTEDGTRVPTTLAEMWLTAHQLEGSQRRERVRLVGDRALYISGYFADSLKRKIVDIDYYIQMGEGAFQFLAQDSQDQIQAHTFTILANHFSTWVDVFHYVAQKTFIHNHGDILRLYETYLKTGSGWAQQQLLEHGVVTPSQDQLKKYKQDE